MIDNQPTNPTALLDLASIKLKETFNDIRLIDYYDAFGVLDSGFQGICADIELLSQMESSEKITQIIPLEIISNLYLQDELNEISNLNSKLSKLSSDFDEMIEGLELEDKEQIFSDDKLDSKALKSLASDKTSVFYKLFENKENQKALDKKIKQTQIELDTKALKTLENLNQADTKKCLEIKWIEPIIKGILALCDDKMGEFISKILNLNERYKDTLKDLDSKIKALSDELVADIENLKCDNENDQEALNELMALLKGSL